MGILECDDGNTANGDGCSAECKIEPYYECKGGSPISSDLCIYRKTPDVKSFKYNGDLTVALTFLVNMKLLEDFEDQISFRFEHADEQREKSGPVWAT